MNGHHFLGDITTKDFLKFKQDYLDDKYPEQRLGQAFYNRFLSGGFALEEWQRRPWPELFYEPNRIKAEALIIGAIEETEHKQTRITGEYL